MTERLELSDDERSRLQKLAIDLWARDLYEVLVAAVAGQPRWRLEARLVLDAIARGQLPESTSEALREIDHHKRVAEIERDLAVPRHEDQDDD